MRRWKGSVMRLAIATLAGAFAAALAAGVGAAQTPSTVDDGVVNGRDTYVFTRAIHPKVYASGTGDLRFHDNSNDPVTTTSARCYGIHAASWDVVCAAGPSLVTVKWPALGANNIDLSGAPVAAFVEAGPGIDTALGTSFADEIHGQADGDTLEGNAGNDRLYGGGLADLLVGGDHSDLLEGGSGNDRLQGNDGADSLYGQVEFDQLEGGDGGDWLEGGRDADRLDGGGGDDYLDGDDYNTVVNGGAGTDEIDGGPGVDSVNYAWRQGRVEVKLDGLRNDGEIFEADWVLNVEDIRGGNGPDILKGDGNGNVINGGAGNDEIDGGPGNDHLIGSWGEDTIVGGDDKDLLLGGDDADLIISRDGVAEQVGCGSGADRVIADRDDVFPGGDCELVDSAQRQTVVFVDDPRLIIEGNAGVSSATFPLAFPAHTSVAREIRWTVYPGTAASPDDVQSASGTLPIAAWATSGSFTVDIAGDILDEPTETFEVEVELFDYATAVLLDERRQQVTIVDDDPEPSLSVDDPSIDEAGKSGPMMTFTVSLSEPSAKTVTVEYTTRDGTAHGWLKQRDYEATHDMLTFFPGETAQQVDIAVHDDAEPEADETFELELTNPINATLGKDVGAGTIIDDDYPFVSIADATVAESPTAQSTAVFTVTLSEPSGRPVTVDYASVDDTAVSGTDYRAVAQTSLNFLPGVTAKQIQVTVDDDALDEHDETFNVQLVAATGAQVDDGLGLGTIVDDDPEPSLSVSSPIVTEGNSGTKNVQFTITLSSVSGRTVRADYATSDWTATAPDDYVAANSPLKFNPGETSKTVTVAVVGDTILEPHEDFYLILNPLFATVTTNGRATILNDD